MVQAEALKQLWASFEGTEYYDFLAAEDTNPEGIWYRLCCYGYVAEIVLGDTLLLRFLRATMKGKGVKGKREFQVEPARERLLKTIKWKQVYAPQYEPENFAAFRKVKPSYVYMDERLKSIVVIEKTGRFWSNADPTYFSDDDWALNFAYAIEKVNANGS